LPPLQALECILSVYVKNNFVGPPSDLPLDLSQMDNLAYECLSVDGETPFPLVRNLSLLWFCKEFSRHMIMTSRVMTFVYAVNYMKSIYLYQNIYGERRCPSIKADFDDILKHADLGTKTKAQENPLSQLTLVVERTNATNFSLFLPNGSTAQPKICPLEDDNLLDFIKFVDDTRATDQKLSVSDQAFVLCSGELHRRSHPHDDLIDEQSLTYVTTVVRAIVEGNKVETNDNGAFESASKNAVSWPVLTEALFKRGLYERRSLARTERAIRQLEELMAQFSSPTPGTEERGMQHFFWSRMPSQWQIELSLARSLTTIGSTKSALDIYLRWQQWDEIISSYTSLGKRDLAEKVIRERIASGHETPELYCCLGDVTSNATHYETAWELSKHRSSRAVRSLGYYAMGKDKDLKKAAEYFEASLDQNRFQVIPFFVHLLTIGFASLLAYFSPLNKVNLWFTLGCCYLQLRDFSKAERAFRYCVTFEPDNFEAWNNLASSVIFSGRRTQSLALLKEATKWNFDSWRIWENILLVAMDERSFGDAITAYHRLIDLRHKHIDSQVLGMLTKAVSENLLDSKNCGAARFRKDLLTLLGRVTSTVSLIDSFFFLLACGYVYFYVFGFQNPSDADSWRHYANLILGSDAEMDPVQFQRAIQYLQRSYQCRLRSAASDWEFDKTVREDLLTDLQFMVKLLSPNDRVSSFTSDPEMKAFITSTLSSLKMCINVYIARLKSAINRCVADESRKEIVAVMKVLSDLNGSINFALRCIWGSNGGRRFFASTLSPSTSFAMADFHQLGCAEFIQRMRQNLIERNSEANFDEMLSLYQRLQSGERDLQPRLEQLYLSLPNFSHSSTPIGDSSKFRLLHIHGSPKFIPQAKNEIELLSNEVVSHRWRNRGRRTGLGTLRSSRSLTAGCGPRAYAFYDSLAVLEAALLQLTLDRTRKAGFQLITVPDLLPTSVIQRCGFPITGARNQVCLNFFCLLVISLNNWCWLLNKIISIRRLCLQIFNVVGREESSFGDRTLFSLSGTAEMALAGFCADRVFGGIDTTEAEFFCAISRCFRHEIAPQESLLYRTHQFTKVRLFTPSGCTLVMLLFLRRSKFIFSVLEMPTSELGNSAHRKIDIEALMPGEGIFGEVSSTSNCTDYQAIRLNIFWKQRDSKEGRHPYAYTLNGTGCAVTRILKALVETNQNSDGSIDIPRILWPYMNGIRKLQMEESPLVTS
uniref:AA_TRNA_LIGASE_II domain-containing protein n=1 Tax=Hydatigena taeniaeformis TaxID=6205 RepID=A0A158RDB1_HYDTA